MGEIRSLKGYLADIAGDLGFEDYKEKNQHVVLVARLKPVLGDELTRSVSTQTIVSTTRRFVNPWEDISVLLIDKFYGGSDSGFYALGRGRTNEVVLEHPTVSRVHSFVSRAGKAWCLQDANSTNGTWVHDGKEYIRLEKDEKVQLNDAAQLRFGSLEAQFFLPVGFWSYLQVWKGIYAKRAGS